MIKLSKEETYAAKNMYRQLLRWVDPQATAMYNQLLFILNPSKRNQSSRDYYARNKKQHNKLTRRWKRDNRSLVCHYASARRAKQITKGDQSAISKIYARAQELRKWFDVVVDHIIPLAKGGAHSEGNLQIIYRVENLRKGARLDYIPTVVFI